MSSPFGTALCEALGVDAAEVWRVTITPGDEVTIELRGPGRDAEGNLAWEYDADRCERVVEVVRTFRERLIEQA